MQLILIHTFTSNQEEEQLNKRSKEISTLIEEQSKLSGKKTVLSEDFFENIIEKNEMIRILDQQGQELFNISQDFPDLQSIGKWLPSNSLQTSIKETNRLIKLTNRLLMLTRMDKQEEQENIMACNATEILNEVIHDYELIYEQLKIAKEDITKTDRLLAIPQ